MIGSIVFGWRDLEDAGRELKTSMHCKLLLRDQLFLYRNIKGVGNLLRVVVVSNVRQGKCNDFGVGLIYSGHSELYSHVPLTYLKVNLLRHLEDKNAKVEKNVIEAYKQIIGYFERRIDDE